VVPYKPDVAGVPPPTLDSFFHQFHQVYLSHYRHSWNEIAIRRELSKLISEGTDPAAILFAANRYRQKVGDNKYLKNPLRWLQEGTWRMQLVGVTIDEVGNPVEDNNTDVTDDYMSELYREMINR
jgi:hypothetical protein